MTPPKRRVTGQQGTQAQPLPARTTERYTPPVPIIQPRRPWWSRLAWPVAILGIIVFVVGWVGAKSGVIAIPFDPHHVLSQFVGFGLVFVGVRLGSGRQHKH